jgi:hypothetical protein
LQLETEGVVLDCFMTGMEDADANITSQVVMTSCMKGENDVFRQQALGI